MQKYAPQLAMMTLCLGACAGAPSAAPSGQNAAPQAAADASPSAPKIEQPASAPSMPVQPAGVATETARPAQPAMNSGAAAASGSLPASADSSAAPTRGDMMATAGSAAPVAGAAGESQPTADRQPVAGCDGDPLSVLRGFAPSDEDLAKDYEKYLTNELGTLTCATSGTGSARTLTQTIFVPPDTIYDGKGETLSADAAAMRCDTSDAEQGESQQPIFVLAKGAQLKNVTIAYPGCEGVHMLGDNVLDHVTWQDAGEDAASVRSYFPGGKITIKNSEGHKAADKMFQFNAPCDVHIENFQGSDMGKLVRQNGGTEFELHIDLNKVNITGVVSAVVQSDSPLCYIRHHELSYMFKGSSDKSDRVFRDVPAANITEY